MISPETGLLAGIRRALAQAQVADRALKTHFTFGGSGRLLGETLLGFTDSRLVGLSPDDASLSLSLLIR